jgi:hypothetical protein
VIFDGARPAAVSAAAQETAADTRVRAGLIVTPNKQFGRCGELVGDVDGFAAAASERRGHVGGMAPVM